MGYLFTPLIPIFVLINPVWNRSAFLRRHAMQALLWSVVFFLLLLITLVFAIILARRDVLFICLSPFIVTLAFVPGAVWARRVFYGGEVSIPILGRFVADG